MTNRNKYLIDKFIDVKIKYDTQSNPVNNYRPVNDVLLYKN
jgi:hypothetical protein